MSAVLVRAPDVLAADPDTTETTPLPVVLPLVVPPPRPAESLSLFQPADSLPLLQPAESAALLRPAGSRPHSHSRRRSGGKGTGGKASQGAARGLLMTPWFAAAAGFVIAAVMWIVSPHAHLINVAPAINSVTGGPVGGHGHVANNNAGRIPQPSSQGSSATTHKHGAAGSTGTRAARPTVLYTAASENGQFNIVITLPAGHASTGWTLRLKLRGDHVIGAWHASWQPSAHGGGIASEQTQDGSPGAKSPSSTTGHDPQEVTFAIFGSGKNLRPTACVLNGEACQFVRQLPH